MGCRYSGEMIFALSHFEQCEQCYFTLRIEDRNHLSDQGYPSSELKSFNADHVTPR